MTFDHINGDIPSFLISNQYESMEQTLADYASKIIVLTDDLTCQWTGYEYLYSHSICMMIK